MNQQLNNFSFLIATDFDLITLSSFQTSPSITFGGWIEDRIPFGEEELIKTINLLNIRVLIVEVEEVSGTVFQKCPSLEVVISMRSNPVNVDLEAANEEGVIVLHAPGRNAQAVAELTLGLMLDVMRSVSISHLDMKAGRCGEGKDDPYLLFRGSELSGKSVGLIGFGAIGQKTANLLAGFDTELFVHDPYQSEDIFFEHNVSAVPLDTLLDRSEIVSIHTPLNDETRGMLGEREISLMKPGAYLINTARAAVVDRTGLRKALAEDWIAGAAFDAHYQEPPIPGDPLLDLPNFLYTPHIGGATIETIKRGSEMVMVDFSRILRSKAPKSAAVYPKNSRLCQGGR